MWIDDQVLRECKQQLSCFVWQPRSAMVVLGGSNQLERECHRELCAADGIPVLQRYGGGGTVLLYPGVVVLSLGTWVRQLYNNSHYFSLLNTSLIETLAEHFPRCRRLSQKGISDIADDQRKIAGTSLFRSRNYLLYQVSLLVDLDIEKIERYLKHPSREPDYRGQKSHRQFLSCLKAMDASINEQEIVRVLQNYFTLTVNKNLAEESIAPSREHCPYLLQKASPHRSIANQLASL